MGGFRLSGALAVALGSARALGLGLRSAGASEGAAAEQELLWGLGGEGPNKPEGVHFLKIQKTGSTSFGDKVMAHFCGLPQDDCLGSAHIDWRQATLNGTYKGRVVTLIRDPVERTLSEFFWLRDTDGHNGGLQPQWDFSDKAWLRSVQDDQNLTNAFHTYLHGHKKNPSRNRQSMYLLGFRDKVTKEVIEPGRPIPGEVYDWDDHPGGLARRAMAHLENLTAYGITECWVPSMRAIARKLGWNVKNVEAFTATRHERNWRKAMVERSKPDYRLLVQLLGHDIPANTPWAEVIPQKIVNEIKRWNNVDMMLYKTAKKRFTEKFNEPCP